MISVCMGLVGVDERTNIIRLVHCTTQEYLEDVVPEWLPNAVSRMARSCLCYLSLDVFYQGWCPDDGTL